MAVTSSIENFMKYFALCFLLSLWAPAFATTLSVVMVYEPVSLHDTDVDDAVSHTGKALQAAVVARPMVLSGAFPETIVEAIRTPHEMPSNDPNYAVQEVNLLELCRIGINAEIESGVMAVTFDVAKYSMPDEIELTVRQALELAIEAVVKTLKTYQSPQAQNLRVRFLIAGTTEGTASLQSLQKEVVIEPS
ncbi:MAG: hypothetical protein ACQKBU_10240 [Verrucomicrobiales bacterium]